MQKFWDQWNWTTEILLGCVLLGATIVMGCGGGSGGSGDLSVTGKVTFQGAPVTAGSILFEIPADGYANQVDLQADGTYQINLQEGDYQVCIQPPIVQVGGGPDTPADEAYQEVADIPEKYRNGATSGLTVQVTPDLREHNFEMLPQPAKKKR